jgi:nucleotide-binding universal stress UspA family protein
MSESVIHRGILVGVDGSAASAAAVAWATRDAAMRNLSLTLVHVVTPVVPTAAPWPEIPVGNDFFRWQDEEAMRVLEAARRTVADSSHDAAPAMVHSVVLHGGAVGTLVDLSKDADMIVVGSRGQGAFSRALLGSVSTGLVHHAHCPVAVIHDDAPAVPADAPVLVGIDGSPASLSATEIAFDEASRRGVDLATLHAWRDVTMLELPGLDLKAMEAQAQVALAERLAGFQERYPDVTVRRVVVCDQPARVLVEHAKGAQLVVVGSHGRGGFAGMLLGSVSTAIVHAIRTPAIVARQG